MILVHTDENKDAIKKLRKINDIIMSTSNNSYNLDEKYMKTGFNSDDDSPLKINTRIADHNSSLICFPWR